MESEEAWKTREGLLLVLGVEKDTEPLDAQIIICQTEIKEDNIE